MDESDLLLEKLSARMTLEEGVNSAIYLVGKLRNMNPFEIAEICRESEKDALVGFIICLMIAIQRKEML